MRSVRPPPHRQRLLLWGMSGCGKTTVAPLLAAAHGATTVDLDARIEQLAGCTIASLFARDGEAAFRALEQRLLRRLLQAPAATAAQVIALGGGTLVDPALRQLALRRGFLVVLTAPIEELAQRLSRSDDRPLLRGAPRARLQALAEQRASAYAQAHLRQPTRGLSAAEVARAVADRWMPACRTGPTTKNH